MSVIARKTYILIFTALACWSARGDLVHGQPNSGTSPELIVRIASSASEAFRSRFRPPAPKRAADSLLAGVRGTQAVLGASASSPKSFGARPPISAFTLQLRDSLALANVRARLRQQPDVQYVHPNVEYKVDSAPHLSDDPPLSSANAFADSLDHLSVIRAVEGWAETTGKASVRVGIIDTGIYFDHPDLSGQFWSNPDESKNGVDDDGNGYVDDVRGYDFVDRPGVAAAGEYDTRDPDPSPDPLGPFSGHGTAVAGVVSAQAADADAGMVGVAPNTHIVPLRAFAGDGRGQTDDIAAAIVYGAQQGFDVLNLSFGRDRPAPLLRDAIEYAVSQGTVVVASAGNAGAVDTPHYPSDYPSVISVLWLAEDGDGVPDFSRSQYGIGVDLGAPGSNVFTTQYPRSRILDEAPVRQQDLYGPSSGSSFAAPQVAGAAALLRSVDSTLSPSSIRSILAGTAADINGASWDHTTGAGRVDVAQGLLQSYPAQTTLHAPGHNEGVTGAAPVPVVGTALDPSFESYAVYVAEGTRNLDTRPDPWTRIAGPVPARARRDTLALWDVTELEDGAYTLRLSVTRTDGRTIEDRRRVVIDASPPELDVRFVGAGRVRGHWGVVADVASDDTVESRMTVRLRGKTHVRSGEYASSRQGLTWSDRQGLGGEATVRLTVTNRSGLQSSIERSVSIPADNTNPSYFRVTETEVPGGTLLPRAPDLDEDGLPEAVLNRFATRRGGISDTVTAFEWAGSAFAPADTLLARLLPKDIGNTNADDRAEFLLQINGASLLLEQQHGDLLPQNLIYADTSAVTPSQEGPSLHAARLADVNQDGRDEIIGNWRTDSTRTEWRVLARDGDGFSLAERLQNPTPQQRPDTVRGSPTAATGDFDGDGETDLLVGDRDGNWIVYEASDGGTLEAVWTHETDRFASDRRFAVGDVTGDGRPEFVTHNTYSPVPPGGGAPEPPISYYHVWSAVGDDTYERLYRLPVAGERALGAMTAADFDEDGRDEVAIVHPPSVLLLDRGPNGTMQLRFDDRRRPAVRSRAVVAADFDGTGRPSLLTATTGDRLRRYTLNRTAAAQPPPRWVAAVPTGPGGSRLRWRAPGADSVTVFAGLPGTALDPRRVVMGDSSTTIADSSQRRFALRAWRNGNASPLSPPRDVRPHAPAAVRAVRYPTSTSAELRFTETLGSVPPADRFALAAHGAPQSVVSAREGTALLLEFGRDVAGTQGRLSWSRFADTSGLPIGQTEVSLAFPAAAARTLFVEDLSVLGEQQVRLTFSEPLVGATARKVQNYRVEPYGTVTAVRASEETPSTVTVELDGVVAGASGREASLTVTSLRSTSGATLDEEGATVRLTQPAEGLANVKVYPNPVRLSQHASQLTVAGLPKTATVRIYSPSGRLVRVLSVDGSRSGGTTWNLRSRRGDRVPSGIYLVRVEAPDASSVLKKAAVIR